MMIYITYNRFRADRVETSWSFYWDVQHRVS